MAESYRLYHYDSCPFCLRVRAFLQSAGIDVPLANILADEQAYRELVQGGGRSTVPCLRIEDSNGVRWLYESMDIIAYLKEKLGG